MSLDNKLIIKILIIITGISISTISYAGDCGMKYKEYDCSEWPKTHRPTIQLLYGTGPLADITLNEKFRCTGLLEVKLGFTREKGNSTPELKDTFIFGAYQENKFALNQTGEGQSSIKSEFIRFGFGDRSGYAYRFGGSYLYPFNESKFSWTRFNFTQDPDISSDDADRLNRIEDGIRFGYSTQTGMEFGIPGNIAIRAGIEQIIVNPRVVFWEFAGSYALLSIGDCILSYLGGKLVKLTPAFGPVLNAALRGAFAYAYYKAMENKMNWPFDSEQPLTGMNLKIGTGIKF